MSLLLDALRKSSFDPPATDSAPTPDACVEKMAMGNTGGEEKGSSEILYFPQDGYTDKVASESEVPNSSLGSAEPPLIEAHHRYNARTVFLSGGTARRPLPLMRYSLILGLILAVGVYGFLVFLAEQAGSKTTLMAASTTSVSAKPGRTLPTTAPSLSGVPAVNGDRGGSVSDGAATPPAIATPPPVDTRRTAPHPRVYVRKKAAQPKIASLLMTAYHERQDGDPVRARDAYRSVLREDPKNRTALIALASIASNHGEAAEAQMHYQRLLVLNPRDAQARAGLMVLEKSLDPVAREHSIRELLAADPNASRLQFMLGNALSDQRRWAMAADAYENALRSDQNNPDYCFDLAVSLDHLGQTEAAMEHYRSALDLGRRRPPGFDPAAVRIRLSALQQSAGVQP